jgi:hypothetical protein
MKKIKFRPLIEKWSEQPLIEVTQEEWDELQNMDYIDKLDWLESNRYYSYAVVNVELNIVDDAVEKFSKMVHKGVDDDS